MFDGVGSSIYMHPWSPRSCPALLTALATCLFLSRPAASQTSQPAATTDAPASQPATQPAAGLEPAAQISEAVHLIAGDNTDDARRIGVRTLIRAASPEAHAELARLLSGDGDGNGEVAARVAICFILANQPDPPIVLLDALLELVGAPAKVPPDSLRAALANFPQRDVFAGLATIAADPARESDVRVAAIQTISQLGEDFATVGALADLLDDANDRVKQAALEAFSSMASADFDSTDEAVAWWRKRGAEIRVLDAQREALSRRLVTAYRDSFLQLPEAAQAGRLVEFIGDESPDIRRLALDLIGGMVIDQKDVPAEVRTAVLRLLNDSDHDIRRRAAITAGNLRIDGAADVLLKAFDTETQPPIRAAIASALGRFGDARAIDPLIAALDSSNTELVTETAVALGKLASNGTVESAPRTRVVEALTRRFERINPKNIGLREQLLRAMARVPDPALRPVFEREAAEDRPIEVRKAALAGLASFEGPEAAEFLLAHLRDVNPAIRAAAAQALGQSGGQWTHFLALRERIDPAVESDATVRDRAWEATQHVYARLGGPARLMAIESFNIDADLVSQRRRASLARSLAADASRMAEFPAEARQRVTRDLADALMKSGDAEAALTQWMSVAEQTDDADAELAAQVDRCILQCALRAGKDDAALARLQSAAQSDGPPGRLDPLMDQLLAEVETLVSTASTESSLDRIETLLANADELLDDAARARLSAAREQVVQRRVQLIDEILAAAPDESLLLAQLAPFDRRLVLERLRAMLSALPQTTTKSATDREPLLLAVATKLAPQWVAYKPGCAPEERAAALAALIAG